MAYADQGTLVSTTGWNDLSSKVNKVFGDVHSGSAPTTDTALQDDYKFGWGNTAQADTVAQGDLIEAAVFNSAIDIVNVGGHVTGDLPLSAYFKKRNSGEKISLNDSDLGQTLQYYTTQIYNNKNTLAPYHGSVVTPAGGIVTRTTPWRRYMAASFRVNFESYDKLRYFFNAGGQIQINPTATGGSTRGYLDWKHLTDQCGAIVVDVNGATCTGNIGVKAPCGLYQLNQTYQLLLTAKASFSGAYGGYGYGGYSGYSAYTGIQIKVWARLSGNNQLLIKLIFDNRAFRHWIDGTTGFQVTYRKADPETSLQNDQVVFNVDPPTGLAILTTFDTGSDDS